MSWRRQVTIADEILVEDVAEMAGGSIADVAKRLKKVEMGTRWDGEPIMRESAAKRVIADIKAEKARDLARQGAIDAYYRDRDEERKRLCAQYDLEERNRRRLERAELFNRVGPEGFGYAYVSPSVSRLLSPQDMGIVNERIKKRLEAFDKATLTQEQFARKWEDENQ